MTAEKVFSFSQAYKLYYQGKFDFQKYKGQMPTPPLIQQKDRQFYHRIANRLSDESVHALFTLSYFHNPKAYIADLVSRECMDAAIKFASRGQNGRPLFESELYDLAKRFEEESILNWLYDNALPPCLQEVMDGSLPLDTACMLLLIPQPRILFDWGKFWLNHPDAGMGLGAAPWVERLKKADQLIFAQRDGWRTLSHALAKEFWAVTVKKEIQIPFKDQSTLFT